ncbi:MAG TPA: thermonuclease family protein [Chloroflexia bacterium]|nr:thermonuclease family protein [Chloroflexia bacterium]
MGICALLALFASLGKPGAPVTAVATANVPSNAGTILDITTSVSVDTSALPTPTSRPVRTVAPEPLASSATPRPSPTITVAPTPTPSGLVLVQAELSRVVDGDTIDVVMGGQTMRVRLIGMDTPETNGAPICYGQEATAYTQHLLDAVGGKLWLEKDISETDRYGRLLRYVWLTSPTESAPGTMLDEQLVADGYAQVSTFPPDVKYVDRLVEAERTAKAAKRGLWGACERFGAPLAAPTATNVALPPTTVRGGGLGQNGDLPYDPFGPDRDCSDFATHDEAQRFFIAAGGPAKDPHRLDADHDGIACETLP